MAKKTTLELILACARLKQINDEFKKALTNLQVDLNGSDSNGNTGLHLACGHGYEAMVQLFLEQANVYLANKQQFHVDINQRNNKGETPLHLACERNNERVVALLLLQNNTDLNILDGKGQKPLHIACKNGHIGIIRSLLASPRLDTSDFVHINTLCDMVSGPYRQEIIKLLLAHKKTIGLQLELSSSSIQTSLTPAEPMPAQPIPSAAPILPAATPTPPPSNRALELESSPSSSSSGRSTTRGSSVPSATTSAPPTYAPGNAQFAKQSEEVQEAFKSLLAGPDVVAAAQTQKLIELYKKRFPNGEPQLAAAAMQWQAKRIHCHSIVNTSTYESTSTLAKLLASSQTLNPLFFNSDLYPVYNDNNWKATGQMRIAQNLANALGMDKSVHCEYMEYLPRAFWFPGNENIVACLFMAWYNALEKRDGVSKVKQSDEMSRFFYDQVMSNENELDLGTLFIHLYMTTNDPGIIPLILGEHNLTANEKITPYPGLNDACNKKDRHKVQEIVELFITHRILSLRSLNEYLKDEVFKKRFERLTNDHATKIKPDASFALGHEYNMLRPRQAVELLGNEQLNKLFGAMPPPLPPPVPQ
jgi:hypothetical protein